MASLRALLMLALFVSSAAFGEKKTLDLQIGGSHCGQNVYEISPDGSFTSETTIDIAGMKIVSKLSGKMTAGKVTEWTMDQEIAGIKVNVTAKDGVAKISSGKQVSEQKYEPSNAYFGNYHFWTYASLVPQKAGEGKLKALVLDSGGTTDISSGVTGARPVDIAGGKLVVRLARMAVGGVNTDMFIGEKDELVGLNVTSQKFVAVAPGFEEMLAEPVTRMKELSQPTLTTNTTVLVKIPMRDGVELAASLARPTAEGKYPAILVRTPYGRAASMIDADWWAKRGYVFISQDVRGRGESKGAWEPLFHERKDGYDTLEWVAKQPWCNGSVGMIGGSYLGYVQWCAAAERHPALKAIIPQVSPPDPFFNFPIDHGIPFIFGAAFWARAVSTEGVSPDLLSAMPNAKHFTTLPITMLDDQLFGKSIAWVDDFWRRDTWSAFGSANFLKDLKNVNIPAMHISGWWDGDGIGTKINYEAMRRKGNQYLIYGPWTHFFNTTSSLGDQDYGPDAIIDLNEAYLRFFDTYLMGKNVLEGKWPKVKVFVMGANVWRSLSDWPDPKSAERTLYLSGDAPANGKDGAGKLIWTKPGAEEPDRYLYNPASLVVDQDELELDPSKATTVVNFKNRQDDVLVFRSDPLTEALDVAGPISVDLYFSSSAVDTDFYAALVDVDEKGVMRAVASPGKLRAKFRNSFDKPELLKPGQVYRITIDIWDTAHQFRKGHKIGLVIGSDSFPAYARNLNTGEPDATATRMVAAAQTIYHDAKRPSVLKFRVLPPLK